MMPGAMFLCVRTALLPIRLYILFLMLICLADTFTTPSLPQLSLVVWIRFLQFEELRGLIAYFRQKECLDDFVIYTGYYPQELTQQLVSLRMLNTIYGGTIILKVRPLCSGSAPVQDPVLGVTLASSNQYAERL